MTDDIDSTDDQKIIELADRTKKSKEPRGGKAKGLADREARKDLFKQVISEAHDEAALEGITEEEKAFAEFIVAGESFGSAYNAVWPEEPETDEDGKIKATVFYDYRRAYTLGARVAKRPAVRAYVARRLDQEEGDVSHTSARLSNFILKRLEHEATYASTPAARLKALELLAKHKVVQATEDLTGAKAKEDRTGTQLLDAIKDKIDKLKA